MIRTLSQALVRAVKRRPLSVSMAVAVIVIHLLTAVFAGGTPDVSVWGFHVHEAWQGNWWSWLTTVLLTPTPGSLLGAVAVLLGLLGLAETTLGARRTALLFVACQLGAALLLTAMAILGKLTGLEWLASMADAPLLGPIAASVGTVMAASGAISLLWRRRLRVTTLASAVMFALFVGHPGNVFILFSALLGLVLGITVHAGTRDLHAKYPRATSQEARTILAIVVAVFAIGPYVATLAYGPVGPLAVLRNFITGQEPTLGQWQGNCQSAAAGCRALMHNLGFMATGGHLLALMPMILLLVCAEGLRRGNRLALWVAVCAHVAVGVAAAIYFQVFEAFGLPLRGNYRGVHIGESAVALLPVVLAPLVIAVALLVLRRHFHIDPDPVLRRRAVLVFPVLLGGFVLLYTVAWFAEGNIDGPQGLLGLLASVPRIVVPYPFPFSYAASVYPHGFFSSLLFSVGGAVLWMLSLLVVLAMFASRRHGIGMGEVARAELLVRQGGDSLSWMTLWPNNHYWFNAQGTVCVAYQPRYGVAVTVGGPVGNPDHYESALDGFLEFCAKESYVACFYSLTDELWEPLRVRGFRRTVVASETLLEIKSMEFKGKEWQNVRTALNKATKLGITAQWCRYSELGAGARTQIGEISEEWVSGQALPEMGFTLGGLQELKDDNVLLCLAIDETGRIHGITSWLPVFSQGAEVSWTLDFMRRNSTAYNGVMEFLIAQAVLNFRESVDWISLSGSPLSIEPSDNQALAQPKDQLEDASVARLLELLGRTLEPVYGFASLANFKRRFQPQHRNLFMMYQDPLALPAIGRAVGEAYMPNVSVGALARLLRKA